MKQISLIAISLAKAFFSIFIGLLFSYSAIAQTPRFTELLPLESNINRPNIPQIGEGASAFADIDNDGDQDLLLTGWTSSYFVGGAESSYNPRLFINNGSGHFTEDENSHFEGVYDSSLDFGDIDGDGDQDVIISGSGDLDNSTELYINEGNGRFQIDDRTVFEDWVKGTVAFEDVDNDNDLDLFITGAAECLYFNDGAGQFVKDETQQFNYINRADILFVDVDGDQDKDLLLSGLEYVDNAEDEAFTRLYINDGNGRFEVDENAPFADVYDGALAAGDFDGDGDPDILLTGAVNDGAAEVVGLYFNDGNGNFVEVASSSLRSLTNATIVTGDVDHDGDVDILMQGLDRRTPGGYYNEPFTGIYLNDGAGSFSIDTENDIIPVGSGFEAKLIDLTGNGWSDIYINGKADLSGERSAIIYSNESGKFEYVPRTQFKPSFASSVAVGDVDADSDLDVFITGIDETYHLSARLYINDGNAYFAPVQNTPFEAVDYGASIFFDADGDGDQDMFLCGQNIDADFVSHLYLNDGTGHFEERQNSNFIGVAASDISAADIDGDHDLDLVVCGRNNNRAPVTHLYVNKGEANFAQSKQTFEGVEFGAVSFGDLDNDGDQDLIVTGEGTSNLPLTALYVNDGTGQFEIDQNVSFIGSSHAPLGIADLDGDNDLDVLITGHGSYPNFQSAGLGRVYINNGNRNFTEEIFVHEYFSAQDGNLEFEDFDLDGDLDVIIGGYQDNIATVIYYNDGSGKFSMSNEGLLPGTLRGAIATGDMNGDGLPDVILTGAMGSNTGLNTYFFDPISTVFINDPCQPSIQPVNITVENTTLSVPHEEELNYQWINCDGGEPVEGAVDSAFEPQEGGWYAVLISNGTCEFLTTCSDFVEVHVLSSNRRKFDSGIIQIYPNPAASNFKLELNGFQAGEYLLDVYDVNGKVVINRELIVSGVAYSESIDVSNQRPGLYILRLWDKSNRQLYSAKLAVSTNNSK